MSNKVCSSNCLGNCKECELEEKKLKAWEIAKSKAVNLYYVEVVNNYINYNRCIDEFFSHFAQRDIYYLTEEEFNLIKEMLICQTK